MDKRASLPVSLPVPHPTQAYWQEPPDEISDLRSSEHLPDYADYVIVGSGISGACTAHNILERQRGARVVMLEARQACSGATGRNGGHTKAASYRTFPEHHSRLGAREAVKIARLEYANIRATHAFAAENTIPCESRPCDTVDIIYDQQAWKLGQGAVRLMKQELGAEDPAAHYDAFDAEETRKTFFTPGKNVQGALRYPAGSISAYKLTTGILKLCLQRGLDLHTTTPVTSVQPFTAPTDSTHKISGIPRWTATTPRGAVHTPALILATNGYTPHLLSALQGQIVPLRGQVTAQRPGSNLRPAPEGGLPRGGLPTTYSFVYDTGYEYMIPRPHMSDVPAECRGDVVIGGGLGRLPGEGLAEFGETDDAAVNVENSAYLGECARSYFGENWGVDDEQGRVRREWTGIMGITKDGRPLVGEMPGMEGVWICAGFNGHGMVLCLKCAEALAHMILGDGKEEYDWFPESFLITEGRLKEGTFQGRKHMKAPPEVEMAKPKNAL